MSESTSAPLLELTGERVIVLTDRGRTFTLACRRILPADWDAYFKSIKITAAQNGNRRTIVTDGDTPQKLLAETVLTGAAGYDVRQGGYLTDIPNWQSRLPLSHLLELGRTLSSVRVSEADHGFTIDAEGEDVYLDATWSVGPDGTMQRFLGLRHTFKTPTEAQHKRYNQQASRSVIVGGSRAGTTIYAGAQSTLCQLYDELIVAVEGYSNLGQPLIDSASIVREMDSFHKFIAAQQLFAPQQTASVLATERRRSLMTHAIQVERDTDGLQQAVRTLFEEAYIRHGLKSVLEQADEETCARALNDLPPREISPSYFLRAEYLLQLSTSLELGVTFSAHDLTRLDVAGLRAVRSARADYERDHPQCPACGERQPLPGLAECVDCHAKFRSSN